MLKTGTRTARSMAFIVALVMMMCLLPGVVSANEITNLNAELTVEEETISIEVTGNITTGGDDVTLLALKVPSGKVFGELTDAELQEAIVYIDQWASGSNGSWSKTFTPRDIADEGKIITIYAGGEGVETTPIAFTTVELPAGIAAAPTLTLDGTSPFVWGEGDIVINVAGGDDAADWIDNVEISGVTHAIPNSANSTITIEATNESIKPASALEEKTVTISFENEDYTAVGNITFKVISAVKGIVDGIVGPTYNAEYSATEYSVTIPADTDEIVYSVKIDDVDEPIPAGRVLEVERDATEDKTVAVKATITAGGFTHDHNFSNIIVRNLEYAGPAIGAEDISFAGNNVYGKTGFKVITIDTNEVNPETQTIKVGDVALYYSPVRDKFVGIVNSADADAAAGAITIDENASAKLYYGKVVNPSDGAAVSVPDVQRALAITKNSFTPSDIQLLAADVVGLGGADGLVSIPDVQRILARQKDPTLVFPAEEN